MKYSPSTTFMSTFVRLRDRAESPVSQKMSLAILDPENGDIHAREAPRTPGIERTRSVMPS